MDDDAGRSFHLCPHDAGIYGRHQFGRCGAVWESQRRDASLYHVEDRPGSRSDLCPFCSDYRGCYGYLHLFFDGCLFIERSGTLISKSKIWICDNIWIWFRMFLIMEFGKRSEEHTSELQSRGHLVCRLLLEKNKAVERH